MPEIRYYTVTETRMVEVTANTVIDAARIANKVFEGGEVSSRGGLKSKEGLEGVWGDTNSLVRQGAIVVEEKRVT